MRSPLTWLAALLAVLSGGMVAQQWQIVHWRAQSGQQSAFLQESQRRIADLTGRLADSETARANASAEMARWTASSRANRQLILSHYQDLLARANLPAGPTARLQDLLVERSEALWDAQDAAGQLGIAPGTAEMNQAMAQATAALDRAISGLVGSGVDWRSADPNGGGYAPAAYNDAAPAAPAVAYAPALAPAYYYAPADDAGDALAYAPDPSIVNYVFVGGGGVGRRSRFHSPEARNEPRAHAPERFVVPQLAGQLFGREFPPPASRTMVR